MANTSKKLRRSTLTIEELTSDLKVQMFKLFEQYYDHVTYERFLQDLNEKTHVFFFHEPETNRLVGFSTIFRKVIPEIAPGVFLFSGDTVIHEDYWGSKALQKSFFWFILKSKLLTPFAPLYWMLMSKGVKTYLMMRKNFKYSFPNVLGPTPKTYHHVLQSFYAMKFPGDFRSELGLILFKEKVGAVKHRLDVNPESIMNNPEAQFFAESNPRWDQGEELACVAEIRFTDFLFHVFKFFIPIRR